MHQLILYQAVKLIPDTSRPSEEQQSIKAFSESITDFTELPTIIGKAMVVTGLGTTASEQVSRAFAKDVLSVEIGGPSRPQLTLVDLPGLIQSETKGVTNADVKMVREITQYYIKQPRTICLAVISALNDFANQGILQRVKNVDPDGDRTLGIITKLDRLEPGSSSEQAFLGLARDEDVFFKPGWHALKNRKYDERSRSFKERNASEAEYFRTSIFKSLPCDSHGICALRECFARQRPV